MDGYGYGMNNGNGWALVVAALLLLVALTALVVWWSSSTRKPEASTAAPVPNAARAILDRRLALGELEPEEYRERLDALHESS